MLASSFCLLSVLNSVAVLALPSPRLSGPGGPLAMREYGGADFDESDLFNSCPGGSGSQKLERADRCTLTNIAEGTVRKFVVIGDPQLNCGGSTDPVTVTLGGTTTVTQTTTLNANLGIDIEGITIGGGAEASSSTSTEQSKEVTYSIPPGRQAVYVSGTNHKSETGILQVNYGDRQFDHFIWFTTATVTRLTPIPDDVQFDVHESDCGTDPRDLSSYNS